MDIQGIIVGILAGLGGASGIWKWYLGYRDRKMKMETLRGMLLDERWEWRTIEALQRAIREDAKTTRELLTAIGARASGKEKEVWTLDKK